MSKIEVKDLPGLRATLMEAIGYFSTFYDSKDANLDKDSVAADLDNLKDTIRAIDVARPLGPDGQHTNIHTPECGCVDIPKCRNCHVQIDEGVIMLNGVETKFLVHLIFKDGKPMHYTGCYGRDDLIAERYVEEEPKE